MGFYHRCAVAGSVLVAVLAAHPAKASLAADIEYEKLAQGLELVRNQVELAIHNHRSLVSDLQRQRRELGSMDVFLRVPMAGTDTQTDRECLESIRQDLAKASAEHPGFRLLPPRFLARWKSAPPTVPMELSFDRDYRIPEDQVADRRRVELRFRFDGPLPADPAEWLRAQLSFARRLLDPDPAAMWRRNGKTLTGGVTIYRFREISFPALLAPDLSRFAAPGPPGSPAQERAEARLRRYRQDIARLWPKALPYLDDMREFALNDARLSFFLKVAR